jgi:hypothetical protein
MTGGPGRNEVELAKRVGKKMVCSCRRRGESEKHPAGEAKQLRMSDDDELKMEWSIRTSPEPKMTQSRTLRVLEEVRGAERQQARFREDTDAQQCEISR